jgi:hypothetical protein
LILEESAASEQVPQARPHQFIGVHCSRTPNCSIGSKQAFIKSANRIPLSVHGTTYGALVHVKRAAHHRQGCRHRGKGTPKTKGFQRRAQYVLGEGAIDEAQRTTLHKNGATTRYLHRDGT